ncbi:MAG: HAD family hydrolase [Candidatus Dojkabacteria bacterium]|nr:MAG: HAD family hydrolase [Candidatus Dojkabacteria bacterium]
MKYKTLLFDLDDTLYDGSGPWIYSIDKTAKYLSEKYPNKDFSDLNDVVNQLKKEARARNPNTYAFAIRSLLLRDALNYYDIDYSWGELVEIEGKYWEYFHEAIQPIDGVKSFIAELSNEYQLYVLTDFTFTHQIKRINKLGLGDYFEDVITAQEVGEIKKTGKIYRYTLDKYQLDPEKTVMIGDTVNADILPAKELGLTTILVPNAFFPPTEEDKKSADYFLDSVLNIRSVLDS